MISTPRVGFGDGDVAELAAIACEVDAARVAVAVAEAAQARALARAFVLAGRVAFRSSGVVRDREMALRGIAAEVAGRLRVTDRWAQRLITDAGELLESYPGAVDAWSAGSITRSHVRVITELGAPLPPDARAVFEAVAVPVCEHETPGRARGRLQRVVERLHPRSFTERHRQAREGRGVRVVDVGEGMSELIATLPTVLARAVYDRLTAQGRSIDDARTRARATERAKARAGADASAGAGAGTGASADTTNPVYERLIPTDVLATDTRTMDQIRADVFADMLLTAAPDADPTRNDDGPGVLGAIRARVQITVPALTALGTEDGVAELAGCAPIDAESARRLLGTTTHPLERLLTHPVTGSVIEVDTYQRPVSLDRFLRARDQHCRFPGCRLAAIRCEIDHTKDWARGGRTHRANLAHLCQRHHSMKQFTAWKVTQLDGGILRWTSPVGYVYVDEPEPPVGFTPDQGEPPGRHTSSRPDTDRPDTDRPDTDRPGTDRPGTGRPGTGRPDTGREPGARDRSRGGREPDRGWYAQATHEYATAPF